MPPPSSESVSDTLCHINPHRNPLAPRVPSQQAALVLRPQVAHLKLEGPRLINVARRLFRLRIQVVDRVLVEGLAPLAAQDVVETRRVGQAEDTISGK